MLNYGGMTEPVADGVVRKEGHTGVGEHAP